MKEELTAEEIGEFLTYMRLSINMKQGSFADELGIRRSDYNVWENGKFRPRHYERVIHSVRVLVKQKIREGA
ncbi:hypothetical protein HMPREF3291_05135 [Bacillus sp. HMSC76G11]|nr:hypothetical protein HMPREF3291_05135 [Bacillus sp. HMSC76G11]